MVELPEGWGDRLIAPVVSLVGVVAVAALALCFGDALTTGVTARAVALVGIAAVVMLLLLAPPAGVLLWMLLAPFGRLFNLSLGRGLPDLSLSRIAAASLLFLLIAQVAVGKRRLARLTAVEGWGIVFLLAMLLSVSTSRLGWVGGVQTIFDTVAVPLLCFYFARNLLNDRRHLNWLAIALAVLGVALGVIAAREQLTNQAILSPLPFRWAYGQHSIKVTSLFGAPAIMAMTLAVPLPFVFVAAVRSRGLGARLLWFAALAGVGTGLLLTYVRAGWLAAVVGIAVVSLLSRRARPVGLVLLLVALLATLVLASGSIDTRAIQERLQSEGPISYRMKAIRIGLDLAAQSPLLGLGLDNYSDAAVASGWQPRSGNATLAVAPHNMFIYVLTSAGVLALAPLLALLGSIGLRGLRVLTRAPSGSEDDRPTETVSSDWAAAAIGMLFAYVVIAITIDALSAQLANILFFLCLGAIFGLTEPRQGRRVGVAMRVAQDPRRGGEISC